MGRILMIEFDDRDTAVFDEIMQAANKGIVFYEVYLFHTASFSERKNYASAVILYMSCAISCGVS